MIKVFENRIEMVKSLPKNLIIAELGVFNGNFSNTIMEFCEPEELVLIDLWEDKNISCGDADGNNEEIENGIILYESVKNKFVNNKNVKIHKEDTITALSKYPDDYFDMIYVDADHKYNGCLLDLEMSYKKVKNGGYIMGHDYEQNFDKAKKTYNFDVNKAVNDFCEKNKQEITMKGNDGCVSFAIKLNKL
jgi:hypothetical protein